MALSQRRKDRTPDIESYSSQNPEVPVDYDQFYLHEFDRLECMNIMSTDLSVPYSEGAELPFAHELFSMDELEGHARIW
jgi:hypothetical protein